MKGFSACGWGVVVALLVVLCAASSPPVLADPETPVPSELGDVTPEFEGPMILWPNLDVSGNCEWDASAAGSHASLVNDWDAGQSEEHVYTSVLGEFEEYDLSSMTKDRDRDFAVFLLRVKKSQVGGAYLITNVRKGTEWLEDRTKMITSTTWQYINSGAYDEWGVWSQTDINDARVRFEAHPGAGTSYVEQARVNLGY